MKLELFMTIPGFENYKISTHGKVINKKKNTEKRSHINSMGYQLVTLYVNNKEYKCRIHRLIAKTFFEEDITNKEIDHIDCNPRNNFIQNLRVCNRQQNLFNTRKQKNNKSGYKGIYWLEKRKRWQAQLSINGKRRTIGYFKDREEAYEKYKEAAKYYHGDFCYQNL